MKMLARNCLIFHFIAFTIGELASPLRELPSAHDGFESMRAQNKVFVDKSEYLLKLVQSKDRFFRMCRPGRFGKSSFLQMLAAYFQGRKELFEGLEIYAKHDWQSSNPVILLDFSTMNISCPKSFELNLEHEIVRMGKLFAVELDEKLPFAPSVYRDRYDSKIGQLLDNLIRRGRKIVVLIDEYDWPLRRFYHDFNFTEAYSFHSVMMDFFRQFEMRANQIEFLFFTCTTVTPWHRNYRIREDPEIEPVVLKDISYDATFSQMVGLTGEELKTYMKKHINAMMNQSNATFADFVRKLKKRFNGYCFSRDVVSPNSPSRLYNFHSVMSFLRNETPEYLWHPASDPKYNVFFDTDHVPKFRRNFLTRYKNFFKLDSFTINPKFLEDQEFLSTKWEDFIQFESVKPIFTAWSMLRYGYVTIKDYNEKTDAFTVNFPNDEMRESYRRVTLELIFGRPISSSRDFFCECNSLRDTMLAGRADDFFVRLRTLVSTHKYGTVEMPLLTDEVFQICHFSCSEMLDNEEGMKVAYLFYSNSDTVSRRKINPQIDGLEVTLSGQVTSIFKFEFQSSAADAMNAALARVVNEEGFGEASQNRTTHLYGINIHESRGWVHDWIKMTYNDGKFSDLQASSPLYVSMYRPYTELKPYSPLALPARKFRTIQF